MTTVRAQCPVCGDVQLGIDDLTVRVHDDDRAGDYRFRCPACGAEHERRDAACHARLVPARGLAWLDNDAVNVVATLVGAGGAVGLAHWWG